MMRSRGFTLIELVIVTIVIGIMAAVLTPIVVTSLRAYDNNLGDLVVLDKLRYATERMAREIREVNYSSGAFAFSTMGNTPVFTRTVVDSTGTSSNQTVTIGNTGSTVTLACCGVAARTLTDELSSLTFTYFDKAGNSGATASTVCSVQISLALSHNGNAYTQQTRVELKNLPFGSS